MQGTLKRQRLCTPNEPDNPLSIRNSHPKPKAPKTGTALNFSSPPTQPKEAKRSQTAASLHSVLTNQLIE
jgi:hypothetical protein